MTLSSREIVAKIIDVRDLTDTYIGNTSPNYESAREVQRGCGYAFRCTCYGYRVDAFYTRCYTVTLYTDHCTYVNSYRYIDLIVAVVIIWKQTSPSRIAAYYQERGIFKVDVGLDRSFIGAHHRKCHR